MTDMKELRTRAPRNRTVVLSGEDTTHFRNRLLTVVQPVSHTECLDRTVHGDCLSVLPLLPRGSVDLLIVDPPYNLTKSYGTSRFKERSTEEYEAWFDTWLTASLPLLKSTSSVYVCSEWRSSGAIQRVLEKHFLVQNRITWEREKGRGALRNWKNCSEDIWFCTLGEEYYFNVEAVKSKRRVIAPYRDDDGNPKDWTEDKQGAFRLTHPSNLWNDISVPFWSMPENTDHPTQKPEKLIAKLILASSRLGDVVLDPFLGSGTTSVVAKKLGRHFIGIEAEENYCLLAEKRLQRAESDLTIQGYAEGIFLERNTLVQQERQKIAVPSVNMNQPALFERTR